MTLTISEGQNEDLLTSDNADVDSDVFSVTGSELSGNNPTVSFSLNGDNTRIILVEFAAKNFHSVTITLLDNNAVVYVSLDVIEIKVQLKTNSFTVVVFNAEFTQCR